MAKKKGTPRAVALEMVARPGKYVHINNRQERHGKDDLQLCADISVRGFHIEESELNHFLGPAAWRALFVAADGKGKPAEPMFRNVDPLKLWDEFEGCDVSFSLGLSDEVVEFEDAFLSKIVLTPQVGGLTLFDCLVSVEVEDSTDVAAMLDSMGDECTVKIFVGGKHVPEGKKAQGSLELGPSGAKPPSSDAQPPADPPPADDSAGMDEALARDAEFQASGEDGEAVH